MQYTSETPKTCYMGDNDYQNRPNAIGNKAVFVRTIPADPSWGARFQDQIGFASVESAASFLTGRIEA